MTVGVKTNEMYIRILQGTRKYKPQNTACILLYHLSYCLCWWEWILSTFYNLFHTHTSQIRLHNHNSLKVSYTNRNTYIDDMAEHIRSWQRALNHENIKRLSHSGLDSMKSVERSQLCDCWYSMTKFLILLMLVNDSSPMKSVNSYWNFLCTTFVIQTLNVNSIELSRSNLCHIQMEWWLARL